MEIYDSNLIHKTEYYCYASYFDIFLTLCFFKGEWVRLLEDNLLYSGLGPVLFTPSILLSNIE